MVGQNSFIRINKDVLELSNTGNLNDIVRIPSTGNEITHGSFVVYGKLCIKTFYKKDVLTLSGTFINPTNTDIIFLYEVKGVTEIDIDRAFSFIVNNKIGEVIS